MRHSLAKFVFILVLAKIDQLDSRAVEVIHTGHGCECHKNLPYHVNVPVQPPPPDMDCRSYGYKIDRPPQARAQYSYSFDFVVEEPVVTTPTPACKQQLFATIDRITMPKPDCVMEEPAPCGIPTPERRQPKPAPKRCPFNRSKVCTCGMCTSSNQVLDYDYEVDDSSMSRSCTCGQCHPSNPQCRYVSPGIQTNRIARVGGRSKRDVSKQKKTDYISSLRDYMKSLKTARDARKAKNLKIAKKSKIVKRDIKGEYDLLQKDQANLDLTIPEIVQYMPETLRPNFKRGKCNIGCENCIKRHSKEQQESDSNSSVETANENNNQQNQQETEPAEGGSNENTQKLPTQQYRLRPRFAGANYLKRSVNPYQYPQPCQRAVMPPPYIPSPLHLATLAENPGNPIWYEPRPLIDPNGRYVYDRLGHKYEVKSGSLKLVTPQNIDEVNVSSPAAPAGDKSGEVVGTPAQGKMNAPVFDYHQMLHDPMLGAPGLRFDHSHDPQMDKVIRDIIYKHPDFIDASQHAPGSLVQPQEYQSDETMDFLKKLIRGRLDSWFGTSEEEPSAHLQDLDRYSRDTGTSVKFIPVVTIDKEKLNKYRQEKSLITK